MEHKPDIKKIKRLMAGALESDRRAARRLLSSYFRAPGDQKRKFFRRIASMQKRLAGSCRIKALRQSSRPATGIPARLPIAGYAREIIEAIKKHQVLVIAGETGSGKTTQIPKLCLEAHRGIEGRIGCTQPRRVAAVTVTQQMASEMGVSLGGFAGYKIRFTDQTSESTVVKVMTDGILLAEAQADPNLYEYDTIIVDEAHERSLNIDFILGMLRRLLHRRPDLKVIITSATIDTEKFSRAFDSAPVIEVSGRTYPVEIVYRPPETWPEGLEESDYVEAAVSEASRLVRETDTGDILVFMPTEADIRDACDLLSARVDGETRVLPLYARLSAADQAKVFSGYKGRSIIVSTNVAETSVTIPGIKYVIDTGLARIPAYQPSARTTAMPVTAISRSSADQRAGRCGRVAEGVCIRLYSEEDYLSRPRFTPPEILRSNLAEVILRMLALRLGRPEAFPFIDPPPASRIKDGFDILHELGAITKRRGRKEKGVPKLSSTGRIMARIPLDPRLARIIIEGARTGTVKEAVVIAAYLAVMDPRERPREKEAEAEKAHSGFIDPASDFMTAWNIFSSCVNTESEAGIPRIRAAQLRAFCRKYFMSYRKMREWIDLAAMLYLEAKEAGVISNGPRSRSGQKRTSTGRKTGDPALGNTGGNRYEAVHRAVLSGFLSHVARKKEKNTFHAARGGEVHVFPGSGIFNRAGEWIVAAGMVRTTRRFARIAANIKPEWIEGIPDAPLGFKYHKPRWDEDLGEVVADQEVRLYNLIISFGRKVLFGRIDPVLAKRIFIMEALVKGRMKDPPLPVCDNLELVSSLRLMEEKIRQRGIVADDDILAAFYDKRIGRVSGTKEFIELLEAPGVADRLRMTVQDAAAWIPDDSLLELFPDRVRISGLDLSCSYRFAPGEPDDGVTLDMTVSQASMFLPESGDWIVPGLLEEKILALIKRLPKSVRKNFVPASRTAAVFLERISQAPVYQGSLAGKLSGLAAELYGISIPAALWKTEDLPLYLKFRFRVTDSQGREVAVTRDPYALLRCPDDALSSAELVQYKVMHEKENVKSFDFDKIPEVIPAKNSKGDFYPLFLYLADEGDKVSLRLHQDKRKADLLHRQGVAKLFGIYFAAEIRHARKAVRISAAARRVAFRFGGTESIINALMGRVMQNLFNLPIRSRKEFAETAARGVNKIYQEALSWAGITDSLLCSVADTLDFLESGPLPGHGYSTNLRRFLAGEVERLVPRNFVEIYDKEKIADIIRYLKAVRIRAQRGSMAPDRDLARQKEVDRQKERIEILISELNERSSPEKRKAVEEFYWLVEEYKVSLFAQEIGTAVPVSEKRLCARFEEIRQMA